MRFQFIAEHAPEYPVRRLCRLLGVSPSGYYAWQQRPVSPREKANQALLRRIEASFEASHGTYGSPRVYHDVKATSPCSVNRVARLMRLRGLRAKTTRRFRSTTKRAVGRPVAPNRLQRDFTAHAPNEKWLADITYIPTQEGWLYLATVLDVYSRYIVGWAMSDQITSDLTQSALQMALDKRQPPVGLLHHSDQGRQYTDQTYQAVLSAHGIQVSMNGVGTWYDNAPMESFFATLKREWVYPAHYQTRNEARSSLFYYLEAFYNRHRRHSSLGYLRPEAYEQLYHQRHL